MMYTKSMAARETWLFSIVPAVAVLLHGVRKATKRPTSIDSMTAEGGKGRHQKVFLFLLSVFCDCRSRKVQVLVPPAGYGIG